MNAKARIAAAVRALRQPLQIEPVAPVPPDTASSAARASADEIRLKLFENAVTVASDAYKENARITAVLDDKAQKVSQTAGLFLAAGFAVMKPGGDNIAKYIGGAGLLAMAIAVGLLMTTVILTLIANWLRRIPAPLDPETVLNLMAIPVAQLPDAELTLRHRVGFLRDMAGVWIEIVARQQSVNRTKGRLVKLGQLFLALATMIIGVVLILVFGAARM